MNGDLGSLVGKFRGKCRCCINVLVYEINVCVLSRDYVDVHSVCRINVLGEMVRVLMKTYCDWKRLPVI